jgi:hypothetical protein
LGMRDDSAFVSSVLASPSFSLILTDVVQCVHCPLLPGRTGVEGLLCLMTLGIGIGGAHWIVVMVRHTEDIVH